MTDVVEVVQPNTASTPVVDDENLFVLGDRAAPTTEQQPVVHRRAHDLGQLLRGMFAGVILAALVALGIDNRRAIAVSYVFGDGDAQLWVLLAVAAVGGMLFGWLVAFRSHRSK